MDLLGEPTTGSFLAIVHANAGLQGLTPSSESQPKIILNTP
jgi:hypothetical protein